MKIWMPDRIINRHVGGNTTYARSIRDGLQENNIKTEAIPSSSAPQKTILKENLFATSGLYRKKLGYDEKKDITHWVADTGSLVKSKAKTVATVHGVASHHASGIRNSRAEFIWRKRVARAIQTSDRLITVSHSSAVDISEVFSVDIEKIDVIHHGIDNKFFDFDFSLLEQSSISKKVLEATQKPYILYLGNIEPRKNIGPLIRAIKNTPNLKEVHLVIAGKPAWDFKEVMSLIEETPNVTHLGFVSDEERLYLMRNTDLFVFPSLYEGFGFPVLEALATGAPVLCSDKGALKEVLGPSLVLESITEGGIAEGLEQALGNSDKNKLHFQEAGPKWARKFTWENSVNKHIKIYEDLSKQ